MISSMYSDITQYISAWVDVQELVKDISSLSDRSPSMRDSLLAVGFGDDRQVVLSRKARHCAGVDAVRILALLANLLAFSQDTTLQVDSVPLPRLSRARVARKSWAKGMSFAGRPSPKEFLPFIARVAVSGGPVALTQQKLYDSFAEHMPTAIGVARKRQLGWVCLPSFEALEKFVENIDNTEEEDGRVWKVLSEFDSLKIPLRTAAELYTFQEAELNTRLKIKKEIRKQKHQNLEDESFAFLDNVDSLFTGA